MIPEEFEEEPLEEDEDEERPKIYSYRLQLDKRSRAYVKEHLEIPEEKQKLIRWYELYEYIEYRNKEEWKTKKTEAFIIAVKAEEGTKYGIVKEIITLKENKLFYSSKYIERTIKFYKENKNHPTYITRFRINKQLKRDIEFITERRINHREQDEQIEKHLKELREAEEIQKLVKSEEYRAKTERILNKVRDFDIKTETILKAVKTLKQVTILSALTTLSVLTILAVKGNSQSTNTGVVTKIIDGDSVKAEMNGQVKNIRLACIDAMEAKAPMGKESTATLQSLIPIGTTVTLNIVQVDRYSRLVAEIYKNEELINEKMLEAGAAIIYPRYLNNCKGNREQKI